MVKKRYSMKLYGKHIIAFDPAEVKALESIMIKTGRKSFRFPIKQDDDECDFSYCERLLSYAGNSLKTCVD